MRNRRFLTLLFSAAGHVPAHLTSLTSLFTCLILCFLSCVASTIPVCGGFHQSTRAPFGHEILEVRSYSKLDVSAGGQRTTYHQGRIFRVSRCQEGARGTINYGKGKDGDGGDKCQGKPEKTRYLEKTRQVFYGLSTLVFSS